MKLALLLLALSAAAAVVAGTSLTEEERKAFIAEAIAEAKQYGKEQSTARQASIQRAKTGKLSGGEMVGRLFKKPTESARKQGEARLRLDDMVRRAERKLAEAERKTAGKQTPEEKAETLAKELFHKPGSMLTSDEIALMTQESECLFVRERPRCTPKRIAVRTIDGTCNNLKNPLFGASETKFERLVPEFYEDGIDALRGNLQFKLGEIFQLGSFVEPIPSARVVSKNLIFRNDSREEEDFTHILMQWGQFLDHDLDLSPELEAECEGCEETEICRPIRVPKDDTVFGVGTPQNGECLRFPRSLPACPTDPPGSFSPREQLNTLTSFIDGSNVYGSNERIGNAVRLFENGLLREGPSLPGKKPSLPIDTEDIVACLNSENCFLAGDVRANEQISLTIMHTLWFREHNRIARRLKQLNPFWNDERLFQESRKIVGALLQKITYVDYLPKVMGYLAFNGLIGEYLGYDKLVNPGVPNSFATAAYRYGHSLVRPEFGRLDSNFRPLEKGPLKLVDAFFRPEQFNMSMGTDPIVRGWLVERVQRADSNINKVLRTQLFERAEEGIPGLDLASLNIQRGRDHGLPPLPIFEQFCRREFPFLYVSPEQFQSQVDNVHFLQVYGSLVDVDLWIGGLAESRLPDSFIGATFACIFGITFNNVRNGDRFWYENDKVFTPAQLAEIRKGTVSRVICDNADDIDQIQPDAFLSNQSRISCDRIPSVDLTQWQERPCFTRVKVEPLPQELILEVFSALTGLGGGIGGPVSSFARQIEAANEPQFTCMPVQCATNKNNARVVFTTNNARQLMFQESEGIAPNLNRRKFRYVGTWKQPAFTNANNGIFTSLRDCERANNEAFALDVLLRGTIMSDTTGEEDEDNQEFIEFLGLEGDEVDTGDGNENGSSKQAKKEEVSDQALISELEQALKDLSV